MATVEGLLGEILTELKRGGGAAPSAAADRARAEATLAGKDPEAAAAEVSALEKTNALLQEKIEKLDKYYTLSQSTLEATQQMLVVEEELNKNGERAKKLQADVAKQKVDTLQKQLAHTMALKEAGEAAEEDVKKIVAELKVASAELEKLAKKARRTEKLKKTFSAVAGGVGQFVNQLKSAAQELANATSMTAGLDSALSSVISLDPAAPFRAFVAVTAGAVKETDLLRANFVAMTGDANAVRDSFVGLVTQNKNLGIGFKEMQESLFALREGFDDFLFLSSAARDDLNLQVATFEKFGIAGATTVESLNTLTQSFGMSRTEAMALQRSMVGLARELELPPKVIAEEFGKAMPTLREFGDRAEDVFRRLAIASRETGLEIQNITAVFGDAMNTYQGSTKAAGQLNAVLGAGIISGTELLMADTEERFRIVQQSLEMTGRSFESLGRFEKISFAQAAGFRSVDEAARAFGNTQDDIATRIGNTTITQEEMNRVAEEATDTMTKLKFAFLSVAGEVGPLADKFAGFVTQFIEDSEAMGGILKRLKTFAFFTGLTFLALGVIIAAALAPFLAGAGAIGAVIAPVVGSLGTAAIGTGVTAIAGLGALSVAQAVVDDAIIKGDRVIPINTQDDVLAAKPGGAIDNLLGHGTADEPGEGRLGGMLSALGTAGAGIMEGAVHGGLPVYVVGSRAGAAPRAPAAQAARGDTTLVVKVMIDDRELGEAMIPHIDKRVLGTV